MEDKYIQQLLTKLDVIIKLLIMRAFDKNNEKDAIIFLSAAGYQPKDIAKLLGCTPNAVRVGLHRLRKADKKTKKDDANEQWRY